MGLSHDDPIFKLTCMKYVNIFILVLLSCNINGNTEYIPVLEMIKYRESFQPSVYTCPAGVLTQGYGITKNLTQKEKTKQQAEKELIAVMESYYNYTCNRYQHLTNEQCWAVVSIGMNCKFSAIYGKKSSFHKALIRKETPPFEKFVYYKSNGCWFKSTNLVNSRLFEKNLFNGIDVSKEISFYKKQNNEQHKQ